jgi:site-specific DNA-cytosine methylase
LRTFVFKDGGNENDAYRGRPLKVVERENLMGFPEGYIEHNGKNRRAMDLFSLSGTSLSKP